MVLFACIACGISTGINVVFPHLAIKGNEKGFVEKWQEERARKKMTSGN